MIHYDLPRRIDDYVHRSGRTGRFGRSGMSIGFANAAAKGISGDLAKGLVEAGTQPPPWLIGMAISAGIAVEDLQKLAWSRPGEETQGLSHASQSYGAQDVRLKGAGLQTAVERREAQKLRSFAADAYGREKDLADVRELFWTTTVFLINTLKPSCPSLQAGAFGYLFPLGARNLHCWMHWPGPRTIPPG